MWIPSIGLDNKKKEDIFKRKEGWITAVQKKAKTYFRKKKQMELPPNAY